MSYIIFSVIIIGWIVTYSLCVVSSKSDDEMDKITEIEERNDY